MYARRVPPQNLAVRIRLLNGDYLYEPARSEEGLADAMWRWERMRETEGFRWESNESGDSVLYKLPAVAWVVGWDRTSGQSRNYPARPAGSGGNVQSRRAGAAASVARLKLVDGLRAE